MSKLKLKINVNLPQLLCIVVSAALNGEFERFGGFCVACYYTLQKGDKGGKLLWLPAGHLAKVINCFRLRIYSANLKPRVRILILLKFGRKEFWFFLWIKNHLAGFLIIVCKKSLFIRRRGKLLWKFVNMVFFTWCLTTFSLGMKLALS